MAFSLFSEIKLRPSPKKITSGSATYVCQLRFHRDPTQTNQQKVLHPACRDIDKQKEMQRGMAKSNNERSSEPCNHVDNNAMLSPCHIIGASGPQSHSSDLLSSKTTRQESQRFRRSLRRYGLHTWYTFAVITIGNQQTKRHRRALVCAAVFKNAPEHA